MDNNLEWRYEQTESGWAVVADNLPGYRAEIRAVVPTKGQRMRVWTIYEQQQVIARGATISTVSAKRACAIYMKVAKTLPMFEQLPPLNIVRVL